MVYDILILDPDGFPLPGADVSFFGSATDTIPMVSFSSDASGYVHIDSETDGALLAAGVVVRFTSGNLEPFTLIATGLRPDTEVHMVRKSDYTKPLIVGSLLAVFLIALYKN
jgi:hypothetical protein